jgi:hypothetical protein
VVARGFPGTPDVCPEIADHAPGYRAGPGGTTLPPVESVPRPNSLDPFELGFSPQPPVAWLSPSQLAGTAVRVVLSNVLGAYLDKRELQSALSADVFAEHAGAEELWLDYVADLGDGFDATYSIAWLLAQPSLTVDGQELPRGQVLVMGGDEVYPTANTGRYEDRTKGPYRAALPSCPPETGQPDLFALPGNHDWYDGLTAFLRMFAKNGADSIGGWVNRQARSYFAIQLPQRWWLFAFDAQFGTYLDDPQMHYFLSAAQQLRPGDNVIVCPATPGWVEAVRNPKAYDTIDYFVRTVLDPAGVSVRLMLSGDLHHYARYESADATRDGAPERQLITCGGGGAYLYPTHHLPDSLLVPPLDSRVKRKTNSKRFSLTSTFPAKAASRALAAGVFSRLPLRNKGFVALMGAVHVLFMLSVLGLIQHARGNEQKLFSIPAAMMGVIILGACAFFAMPPTEAKGGRRHWILGLSHGTVHIGLSVLGAFFWNKTPFAHWPWPLPVLTAAVIYGFVAGLVATEVTCLYLLIAGRFDVNVNELFAGQGIDDFKSFLRIHIGPDGLTIYPIAVRAVGREWVADPGAPRHAPWITPTKPIGYDLAEPPIHLPTRVPEPA